MTKVKQITAIILLLCTVFFLCSCDESTYTNDEAEMNPVENMTVSDLSSEILIVGKKICGLHLGYRRVRRLQLQ